MVRGIVAATAWCLVTGVAWNLNAGQGFSSERPNILWISSEDNGPQLGCYGDAFSTTPNLDGLASRGMRYQRAWSCAPVCAPARTTIITGVWPTSTGAMHMRSQVTLPETIRLLPQYLRQLGYYCSNNVKEDYNLEKAGKVWDDSSNKAHWRNRASGQPFFSVFNFTVSHESQIRKRPHKAIHDPKLVPVPPYHPDLPDVRQDWAQYYDKITEMDREVGKVLRELDEDNLRDNTIIFYFGDHGSGMPRSKRWLYESGLKVPLMVSAPPKYRELLGASYREGGASDELVCFVDLAPTMISLAGGDIPTTMQGQAFLGPKKSKSRQYIYGFRDRMDERYDCSRAIRDERFAYIRNFMPHRPQGQFLSYMFETPTTVAWQSAFQKGSLTPEQSYFWVPKDSEELYDLEQDPFQVKNLAKDPAFREVTTRMRDALRSWMLETRDLGLLSESDMLARAKGESPYQLGHDSARYDLESIERAADIATRTMDTHPKQLRDLLSANDAAIRYWGAVGYLVRGVRGIQVDWNDMRTSSKDSSLSVQVIALESLARFGTPEDRQTSIARLWELADSTKNDLFVSVAAMNALDHSQLKPTEKPANIKDFPSQSKGYPQRYDTLLPKLIEKLAMP